MLFCHPGTAREDVTTGGGARLAGGWAGGSMVGIIFGGTVEPNVEPNEPGPGARKGGGPRGAEFLNSWNDSATSSRADESRPGGLHIVLIGSPRRLLKDLTRTRL